MPEFIHRLQRLYVDSPLSAGVEVELNRAQSNYLLNVLRMGEGADVLMFNGHDGEWLAHISIVGKKETHLVPARQTRQQPAQTNLRYCFAPLKHARLDYMIQKAVEMGAGLLQPVLTQHTQVKRLNMDRIRANIIEAAEQCGILALPSLQEPLKLLDLIGGWDQSKSLIFCDERDDGARPLDVLGGLSSSPEGLLIGPEGGFSDDERVFLLKQDFVVPLSLGPRILRADTAAVAAISLLQSTSGDW